MSEEAKRGGGCSYLIAKYKHCITFCASELEAVGSDGQCSGS